MELKKKSSTSSLDSLNGHGRLKNLTKSLKRKFDKMTSSPSLTKGLLNESETEETPQKKLKSSSGEIGSILKRGIKFASEQEFVKFISKKREKKGDTKDESPSGKSEPIRESKKLNVAKIKELLSSEEKQPEEIQKPKSEHEIKLQSAHFRHLNEQLYTQTGHISLKMFQKDPDAFKIYHSGFQAQATKWPVDPLDKIIAAIIKLKGQPEIADFGCGEARLARSLKGCATVHSYDLVKINDLVTVCDFANTPLKDGQCDVVVFCLSLMGTNLKDFVKEANRVLKMG